jgi:hypothetical protein
LLIVSAAFADQITFNFTSSPLTAQASGLAFGPSTIILVRDDNTGNSTTISATASGTTGTATSFIVGPPLVASFSNGGPGSIIIEDSMGHVFLEGSILGASTLGSSYPDGVGHFGSNITVTEVAPGVLAALGLGTGFDSMGSISLTLGSADFTGGILTAEVGGGTVTIETPPPVPETLTLVLMGSGLVILARRLRRLGVLRPA